MGHTRREFLRRMAAVSGVAALGGTARADTARKPNMVFILADDLGWMDTEPYGSAYYETPNIARLARRSMRFTDAYSANPLCSPTRASLMTGKYPARLGFTTPCGHLPARPDAPIFPERAPVDRAVIEPRSRCFLPLGEYTLGEALGDAGYRTGFIGKWHMGHDERYWPDKQGFDGNIAGGRWPGPPSYFSPYRISTLPDGPPGEYLTDRLADEAVGFIRANREVPFFLCFWQYAVHAPYQARESLTEEFVDKQDPRGEQENPVMGGMIKSLDQSVGRLLDTLDELGLADDTIIVLFSDNGGNEYDRVGPQQWTPTNNDPLRSGKGAVYEGGVRVPMMVSWPGAVEPGSVCREPVMSMDLYPTILAMAGARARPDQTIDGESLVPLLRQEGAPDRDAIFCHMPHTVNSVTGKLSMPSTWVRKGDWKLIRFYETCEEFPNEFELYNLRKDIGETNNLAGHMPEKVRELDALIERFLGETGAAVPRPNPNYDPDALSQLDGWRPSRDAGIRRSEHNLVLESTGGDPFIYLNRVPPARGRLALRFRMRSRAKGGGMTFWSTRENRAFGPQRRPPFHPVHDGEWHEYAVPFTCQGTLNALRIDPATAPGVIEFDWIRLVDANGRELAVWQFEK